MQRRRLPGAEREYGVIAALAEPHHYRYEPVTDLVIR